VIPGNGLTTGLFLPNPPAPEREIPEYTDAVIADNTPRDGYTPVPGIQPLGDNNPKGDIPGIPLATP
jgi:hypothetical protein